MLMSISKYRFNITYVVIDFILTYRTFMVSIDMVFNTVHMEDMVAASNHGQNVNILGTERFLTYRAESGGHGIVYMTTLSSTVRVDWATTTEAHGDNHHPISKLERSRTFQTGSPALG